MELRTIATEEGSIYDSASKGAGDAVRFDVSTVAWIRLLSAHGRNQCMGRLSFDVGLQHPLEGGEVKAGELCLYSAVTRRTWKILRILLP